MRRKVKRTEKQSEKTGIKSFFKKLTPHLSNIKKNQTMTVYGHIRVSTNKQTTENQRFEMERFLENIFNVFDFICFLY